MMEEEDREGVCRALSARGNHGEEQTVQKQQAAVTWDYMQSSLALIICR